ncbi:hypothetical protein ABIA33_000950 [Streptacidiphilus sp. MAP12-16]|uniref:hypothetical protein n=1 Tax=Streptacidiphilus sp. MAP12-16 TaxID=3156300 RepID=UPI0035123183
MNHRRPNSDELTPDDLFRPEPAVIPGEVVRSTRSDMPWDAPTQQVEGRPEYFGDAPAPTRAVPQQQVAEEASTQFMPPFPAAATQPVQQPMHQQPTYGGGYQQGYQQPQGYDQGGYGGYGGQSGYQSGYQEQEQEPEHRPGPPWRRFSSRTIAAGVVGVCAVLGICVAAALSGGSAPSAAATRPTTPAAGAKQPSTTGSGSAAANPQAQALSDLLSTASNSRSAVISAVSSIEHCQNLDQAQQDLTSAAGMRQQLVVQLGTLQTDQLQSGPQLIAALQDGWKASESADSHYAAWAAQSKSPCAHKHKPQAGGEKKAGDAASSTATVAKAKASRLWNAIADGAGLPKRAGSQL